MASYESFAQVYDLYMDNVPYDTWCHNLLTLLEKYHIPKGLVAELGCGTGKMTRLLAREGFDMIGIDNSYDMLGIAMEQGPADILYLCQDMQAFELYGTVGAVVSVCDSINYLPTPEDLKQVLKLVNNYLDPDGIFIFDVNTEYKYREILGDNVFAENREHGSFIWENEYDEKSRINAYELTLYIENEDGETYSRYAEEHFQRAFSLEEIKKAISESGMAFVEAMDVDTMESISDTTERMYIICKEQGKEAL